MRVSIAANETAQPGCFATDNQVSWGCNSLPDAFKPHHSACFIAAGSDGANNAGRTANYLTTKWVGKTMLGTTWRRRYKLRQQRQ